MSIKSKKCKLDFKLVSLLIMRQLLHGFCGVYSCASSHQETVCMHNRTSCKQRASHQCGKTCESSDQRSVRVVFFNLKMRMRVSLIQSRSSRRDREFLTLTLRLRDETEKKFPPISGIETRSRFIIFTLRHRDENENSIDLILFFETRPRILKLAIFP